MRHKKYRVKLSKLVIKFLDSHHELKKRFAEKTLDVSLDPFSLGIDVRKLQGYKNRYRLRIGKYRFLYEIIDDKILVYFYDVNGRGDIY